jgi:hypothetical protein
MYKKYFLEFWEAPSVPIWTQMAGVFGFRRGKLVSDVNEPGSCGQSEDRWHFAHVAEVDRAGVQAFE